jgi:hypothetical protein
MRFRGVLTRRLVTIDEFDAAVAIYEDLFDQPARLRFEYPEKSLRIAQVGQVLLIGGNEPSLDPFRETSMTFLVEDIEACSSHHPWSARTLPEAFNAYPVAVICWSVTQMVLLSNMSNTISRTRPMTRFHVA